MRKSDILDELLSVGAILGFVIVLPVVVGVGLAVVVSVMSNMGVCRLVGCE